MNAMRLIFGWFLGAVLLWPLCAFGKPNGKMLYQQLCASCHGKSGQGNGPLAASLIPRPLNFVKARYKLRSTPFGQLPTDQDIYRTISVGVPGTSMPPWKGALSSAKIWALVTYLKSLSPRFGKEQRVPFSVPKSPGDRVRGKALFTQAKCFMCHGYTGRGDGEILTTLNYEWGHIHKAPDFTNRASFKGGSSPQAIFFRISGGLHDTPMGGYQKLLRSQERWDLAHYISALSKGSRKKPSPTPYRLNAPFQKKIPSLSHDSLWGKLPALEVKLVGQTVNITKKTELPPYRDKVAQFRAIWSKTEVALWIRWPDPTGPSHPFLDSLQLQRLAHRRGRFNTLPKKPFASHTTLAGLYGSAHEPLRVWRWQSSLGLESWTSRGFQKIQSSTPTFQANAVWREGSWTVLLRRKREPRLGISTHHWLPILLSVRDGANGEQGAIRSNSPWIYLRLKPSSLLRKKGVSTNHATQNAFKKVTHRRGRSGSATHQSPREKVVHRRKHSGSDAHQSSRMEGGAASLWDRFLALLSIVLGAVVLFREQELWSGEALK